MLERLRKMSPEAKKKVVMFCAGLLTLMILGAWTLHSYGAFATAIESTKGQGVAVFSFLEQNVERAYDSFQTNVPQIDATTTAVEAVQSKATTTEATSTTEQ